MLLVGFLTAFSFIKNDSRNINIESINFINSDLKFISLDSVNKMLKQSDLLSNNILPLNPALWYRFESLTTNAGVVTTADDSGNGLTGTVENGAVLSTNVP